jgi:hypothetical protein
MIGATFYPSFLLLCGTFIPSAYGQSGEESARVAEEDRVSMAQGRVVEAKASSEKPAQTEPPLQRSMRHSPRSVSSSSNMKKQSGEIGKA